MNDKIKEFYFDRDDEIEQIGKRTMRKHNHTHFEIYFITKGNCVYFIENKVYHLMPGDIICTKSRMAVMCADGLLEILELQLSGKKRMTTQAFLLGYKPKACK